ncbi:hypothetical protein FLGE108171_04090 [Flavobacterium gelidilacus]|uniref:hypothetical protein n=1 Tax=Flavobacterium gelidilacus TaxID=206041 RepID=UPI0004204592|nr:hypothetical protein [Flavobacterium gelidilacus]
MKTLKTKNQLLANRFLIILFAFATIFTSCNPDDETTTQVNVPSSTAFNSIRQIALDNISQSFQIDVADGVTTLTSANGVEIDINANCLTLNGNAITGQVDIEYVEVFDGGHMLVTNKTTMGKLPNGDMAMLISGGEFFINATQNGQQLALGCAMNLRIPANLTAPDNDMTLWNGVVDNEGNVDWEEEDVTVVQGGVFLEQNAVGGQSYYASFNNFGWTNVDKFASYSGPKTQILAAVPTGYSNQNSAVFLHYDGEGNALAKLDTYDGNSGLFSEHYGQIPVGLACHIIFATEENGQWRYAIKPVTITENAVYTFTLAETTVGSEAQLVAAINALP